DGSRRSDSGSDSEVLGDRRMMDVTMGDLVADRGLNIAQQKTVHESSAERERPNAHHHSAYHHGAAAHVSPNISPCKYREHRVFVRVALIQPPSYVVSSISDNPKEL